MCLRSDSDTHGLFWWMSRSRHWKVHTPRCYRLPPLWSTGCRAEGSPAWLSTPGWWLESCAPLLLCRDRPSTESANTTVFCDSALTGQNSFLWVPLHWFEAAMFSVQLNGTFTLLLTSGWWDLIKIGKVEWNLHSNSNMENIELLQGGGWGFIFKMRKWYFFGNICDNDLYLDVLFCFCLACFNSL